MRAVSAHYAALFGNAPELDSLRDAYALPANTLADTRRQYALNAFFFWTALACGTNRPGSTVTYTNNWPAEALIDNGPTGEMILWSVISFVLLLAGIGALAWYYASQTRTEPEAAAMIPEEDPLLGLTPTPSMRATREYFWTVAP
jgi:nitric oxide reductase subunit B